MRTRSALLDTMLRLLETRPFDQITIREIAKEAGIGYATYFRHFPSKEALLDDLAAHQIASLLKIALPVFFADDTRRACVAYFDYVAEHRLLWTALLTGGAAATLKQEFISQAAMIANDAGEQDVWLPVDLRIIFAVSSTVEITAWWLKQKPKVSIPQIAEILDRLVVIPATA